MERNDDEGSQLCQGTMKRRRLHEDINAVRERMSTALGWYWPRSASGMSDEYVRREILNPDAPGPGESQLGEIVGWVEKAENFLVYLEEKLREAESDNWTRNDETDAYVEFLTETKDELERAVALETLNA